MNSASTPVIPFHPPSIAAKPPADLSDTGAELWDSILADWVIDDAAGLAVLRQACIAADRAELLRRQADMMAGTDKQRALISAELAARALVARLLLRLGVVGEEDPKRGPGRPPKPHGW